MKANRVTRTLSGIAREAKSQSAKAGARLAETRSKQLELTQQMTAIYQKIAPLVLQESPEIKEIKTVQKLLNKLQREIEQSKQSLQYYEEQIELQCGQLQGLNERIEPLEEERDNQLAANSSAQDALTAMQYAQSDSEQQQQQNTDLLGEIDPKLAEYGQQRGFMFLLKRNYGQPNYHAWLLPRKLDAWLARGINYPQNYANYQMLQALRDKSTNSLLEAQQREEQRVGIYQNIVRVTEDALQLTPLYEQVALTNQSLSDSQQLRDVQQMALEEYARGEGETYSRIAAQLSERLAELPLEKLDILVAKTATTDDDKLLDELRALKLVEPILLSTFEQQEEESQFLAQRAKAASKLERLFFSGGYDNSAFDYNWGWGQGPDKLFTAFIDKEISLDEVFAELNRIVRLLPTSNSSGRVRRYSSGSSSSSSSSSSGGGFSSSSSSGGGGFRSTDSF